MPSSTNTIVFSSSEGAISAANVSMVSHKPSHESTSRNCSSCVSNFTDLGQDYTTKSEAAAARWSCSERRIAKAKQQALNKAREVRAAKLRVFNVGTDSEGEDGSWSSKHEEEDTMEEDVIDEEWPNVHTLQIDTILYTCTMNLDFA
ncbi:hypothetical protein N657DRAFT_639236 [Parathielavia appendiculata]|uniref:Uncharacterized protein n=1 Tax=Parathielavia appendiculata TaxID=2587402 RepID=A0AAN6U9J1_9PEZI|nr:hypothetical protein N657DRAFT_639236 [Parathielavia appendiculata]